MFSNSNLEAIQKDITKNKKGFTLVELLIVIAILGLVLDSVFSMFMSVNSAFSIGNKKSDLQQNVRLAANFINQEVRYASTINILQSIPDTIDTSMKYIYVKEDGKLYKNINGQEKLIVPLDTENIKFTLTFSGNKSLHYNVSGTMDSKNYILDSEVSALNLSNTIQGNGAVISYK